MRSLLFFIFSSPLEDFSSCSQLPGPSSHPLTFSLSSCHPGPFPPASFSQALLSLQSILAAPGDSPFKTRCLCWHAAPDPIQEHHHLPLLVPFPFSSLVANRGLPFPCPPFQPPTHALSLYFSAWFLFLMVCPLFSLDAWGNKAYIIGPSVRASVSSSILL